MNKSTITKDLTTGNIALQLITYIAPLFFANVLQLVYSITDMAIVGHFVGKNGLAAISVMGEVITLLTYIAMGFANAGQVLVSQYTGAQRHDKTQDFAGTFFSAIVLFSLVLTAIGIALHKPIIRGINVPEEMHQEALIYFLTCAAGFVFTFGYNAMSAVMRGMGDSRHPFVFVAIAAVTNVMLDLLFVIVFHMGIFGAAFATVLSQCLSFFLSGTFIYRNREKFGFDFKPGFFAIKKDTLKLIIKLGSPLALQGGLIQFVLILVARWINAYGVLIISITGIGNKLNSISQTFSSAVGTSASTMIGQCLGAKKYKRVMKATFVSGCIAVGIASLWACTLMLFPEAVFGIFTNDAEVLAYVPTFLPVAVLLIYSSAFRSPMNGLINGSGNAKMNLTLAIVDGLVAHLGLPVLCGFVLNGGIMGLWYGNAAAAFTPFFLGLIYCFSGKWKRIPSLVDRQIK
ncbi:MAG: MATE family efflux transporter [Clostridia bacterium]|nr:MATE family efflux transporter [Oscillospiraceae bacterium]MBQ9733214.1 MATE family efflux transporter [Clostridia bacterium]